MFCAEGSGLRFDVAACEKGVFTAQCMSTQAGSTFSTQSVDSSPSRQADIGQKLSSMGNRLQSMVSKHSNPPDKHTTT